MGMPEDSVRRRRPKGEPRRLLVESATYLFNERGYASSTRDIAGRAGVSETLMFRYFGSKAGLFREVMVIPFVDCVDGFVAEHSLGAGTGESDLELMTSFVGGLFDLFRGHRGLLAALWSTAALDGSDLTATGMDEDFLCAFERLVNVGGAAVRARAERNEIGTRAIVSMVAGMAVADRSFEHGMPSRDAVVDEIATVITYGRLNTT
jgi:AcrR family transcriptional regulator